MFQKTKKLSALVLALASTLAVFATPANDRKIEKAAQATYNYRIIFENRVKVTALDGIVTLTGTVEDQNEKHLAGDTVSNLPGVMAVMNNVVVTPVHAEKSDGWIALKIRSRLLMKSNVSANTTSVESKDGAVTLRGTAANLAQKELTEIYAKEIDGVKSVKNELVVKAGSAGETAGDKMDDASITSQLKYALLTHKSTSALKTKVKTTDGAVVISGDAASDAEKSLVTKLAEDVHGVKSVKNNMAVKS